MQKKTLLVLLLVLLSGGYFIARGELIDRSNDYIANPNLTVAPKRSLSLPPHPRLYLSDASLINLRAKLKHPIYAKDVQSLRKSSNPTDMAFNYLVWGDDEAGKLAKIALLSGEIPKWGWMEKSVGIFQASLMYDWLYSLLTPKEREEAIAIVKSKFVKKRHKGGRIPYYWNDMWARGPAYKTIAALALAGDDMWADEHLDKAYSSSEKVFSPYNGGAIDVLNTISLDSGGGLQAGTFGIAGSEYEGMFLLGAGLFLTAWQSATEEPVLLKTNFFEKLPFYLVYGFLHEKSLSEPAKQALEYITAVEAGDSASLAMWLLDKYGRAKSALVMRLILGDITTPIPKSPKQLDLEKSKYLAGADLMVSRTGWGDFDTVVYMFARHWDMSRYEPYSGVISIYKGDKPLLVRGAKGKQSFNIFNNSGLWVWDEDDQANTLGQGNTYWQSLKDRSRRALSADAVYDQKNKYYKPETLSGISVSSNEVSATTRYEKLLKYKDVELAERTFTHYIKENIVSITDHLVVSPDARVAWSLRLAEEPQIDGNEISTSGMTIKLSSPAVKLYWSGGEGRELVGPDGHWHGDGKHGFIEGYSSDKAKAERYGAGYLFAEPLNRSEEYHFEAIILVK